MASESVRPIFLKIEGGDDRFSVLYSFKKAEKDHIIVDCSLNLDNLAKGDMGSTMLKPNSDRLVFAFANWWNSGLVGLFDVFESLLVNSSFSGYFQSSKSRFDGEGGYIIPSYVYWPFATFVFALTLVLVVVFLYLHRYKVRAKRLFEQNKGLIEASHADQGQDENHRFYFENSVQGVVWCDSNGEIVNGNQAATDILGLSMDRLLGMTLQRLMAIHEDGSDYPIETHPVMVALQTKKAVRDQVMGVLNPLTNSYTWINVNAIPKSNGHNGRCRVVVTFEDITEIRNAKHKVEERDHQKSIFLQNMSHEVRTPLNGILGFLDLMKEDNLSEGERNRCLEIISNSSRRLLNTINDVIEMSKIESNQVTIQYSSVNVFDILDFQYLFFKQQAEDKGIALKLVSQVAEEKNRVETDRLMLNAILTNLISNALKFTHKGEVEFGNFIDGEVMTFFVQDSGIGIPADRVERIFDRFVPREGIHVAPYEGPGLGLSIVKAYIDKLNGKIWVETKVGKGSTFFFSIPYTHFGEKPKELNAKFEVPQTISKNMTILIAEDDDISFLYIRNLLKKTPAIILHASNGAEAVRFVKENPAISLIMMDIKMPIMNGLEATRQIRMMNSTVPIIAQTAYAMLEDKTIALEAGCNDYVSKPIDGAKFIQLINKYSK